MKEILNHNDTPKPKGGSKTMNSKMKQLLSAVLTVGLLALGTMVGKVHAYSDALNTNNTAQITITIRPNVDRSVTITTDNVNMDLGNVDLTGSYVSTQTVSPATVTIGGTFGNTDLLLSANISGGWNFDADSSTLDTDNLATWVSFTSISSATAPSQAGEYFAGVDGTEANSAILSSGSATFAPLRVGTNFATLPGKFENNITTMNRLDPTTQNKRHMWMAFRMPSQTTTTSNQLITFILTVDSGI